MATPLGTLGLSLVIVFLLCYVLLFFFIIIMNDTLFKSFSMHLYILSYMVWSCITLLLFFLRAYTLNFKLSGGLTACLMT
jgi:hypothetical protein